MAIRTRTFFINMVYIEFFLSKFLFFFVGGAADLQKFLGHISDALRGDRV